MIRLTVRNELFVDVIIISAGIAVIVVTVRLNC
jgi:hypothetical protein